MTKVKILTVAGLLLAAAVAQQTAPDNLDPHENQHCSPRGGPTSTPCHCLGMVGDVQRRLAERCWGPLGPPPHIKGVPLSDPTPEVLACLGAVPDHCDVIATAEPWSRWSIPVPAWVKERTEKGFRWPHNQCSTRCKPEKCGCRDQACKSHDESEVY
jgi:hypothetical protein